MENRPTIAAGRGSKNEVVLELISGDRRLSLFFSLVESKFYWVKSTSAKITEMEDGETDDAKELIPLIQWVTSEGTSNG